MALDAGASGGTAPSRQRVARQTTIRARPAPTINRAPRPAPQPTSYSAPVRSNSSGQYSGGGGAPSNPAPMRQGPVQRPGRPGPNRNERDRRAAIDRRGRDKNLERKGKGGSVPRGKGKDNEGKGKKTGIPSIDAYLMGDTDYQGQVSALQKELEDYILANQNQQGDISEDFTLANERMGQERTKALEDLKNDFAARGLLNSSEFSGAIGEYDTQYQTRIGDLTRDRDRNLEDLLESLGMYRNTNQNELQNARAEAIRRRAEQYGIGG